MRTGVRKATLSAGVERVAVLVAGGHGRRTAPVALGRCRAPILTGRPQHQHRCARQVAGIVASTFILGTGEGRATLGA